MAHVDKFTRSAVGHLTKHYERAKDENGEYIRFGNQSIDTSKTYLNYNLAPSCDQVEKLKNRLSEVHASKREDLNVLCDWVVTLPKWDDIPEQYEREFFERSYEFLKKRYGEENVISAYVHKDETTPHMHFSFVPVIYDRKKDRYKVSAKEVLNRKDLQTFHADLQAEMDKFVQAHNNEFECNVLNGATAEVNKTIAELKAQTAREKLGVLEKKIEYCQNRMIEIKKSALEKQEKWNELKAQKEKWYANLKAETEKLKRARDILRGDLEHEIMQSKFVSEYALPYGKAWDYLDRGELLALYKDGTIRQVGRSSNGGFDRKTLDDEEKGLCVVGIMQDEMCVRVPKNLIDELIQTRDRAKPISKELQNLIRQQSDVTATLQHHDYGAR